MTLNRTGYRVDEPDFYTSDDESPCPVCPGLGSLLGVLGSLAHYRCRDCGALWCGDAHELEHDEDLEAFERDTFERPDHGAHPFS